MEAWQITQVVRDLAQQLPSQITILVCIVVVITRWKRHPKVSLLAFIGLALLLLDGPVFILINAVAWSFLIKSTYGTSEIANVLQVMGFIHNCGRAIAFAPLLAAIFIRRSHQS